MVLLAVLYSVERFVHASTAKVKIYYDERVYPVSKFVAERIFKNEGLNLAIVGKFKDSDEFKNILHF